MSDLTEPQPIKFAYEDVGFCRLVYQSKTTGNIFCFQEEFKDHWEFYYCTPDEEPIGKVTPPPYVLLDFNTRIAQR